MTLRLLGVDFHRRSGVHCTPQKNFVSHPRARMAYALHQAGRRAEAEARFRESEEMQAERQPAYPLLYSTGGFRYCDLLLAEPERAAWQAFVAAVWRPPQTSSALPVVEGSQPSESVGIVDVEDGRVIMRRMPERARELQLVVVPEHWTQARLVGWFDSNIPHPDIEPDDSNAYLDAVVTGLQRQMPPGRLVKERFGLRRKIADRIVELRKAARRQEYQRILFGAESQTKVRMGSGHVFAYNSNCYPRRMARPPRLERGTTCLEGRCSIQLSYGRNR